MLWKFVPQKVRVPCDSVVKWLGDIYIYLKKSEDSVVRWLGDIYVYIIYIHKQHENTCHRDAYV